MEDWKERLRDLYLVNNDDISSPNSIEFNWGGFLFKRKTAEPMHFYLATQESIEDFIEQEIEKAREELGMEIYDFVESESGKSGRKEILEFISKLTTK